MLMETPIASDRVGLLVVSPITCLAAGSDLLTWEGPTGPARIRV